MPSLDMLCSLRDVQLLLGTVCLEVREGAVSHTDYRGCLNLLINGFNGSSSNLARHVAKQG